MSSERDSESRDAAGQDAEDVAALRRHILETAASLQKGLAAYTRLARRVPSFILGDDFPPIQLAPEKLMNCRTFETRAEIIRRMPNRGRAVEIGTQTGLFAKVILETLDAIHLTTIDISYDVFDHDLLRPHVAAGRLETIEGESALETARFPDEHFEFMYIDAGHHYDSVKADLAAARLKVKVGGHIICNDYTWWSPFEGAPYGVVQAVNEFLAANRFEVSFFALHPFGYHDIALRRLA